MSGATCEPCGQGARERGNRPIVKKRGTDPFSNLQSLWVMDLQSENQEGYRRCEIWPGRDLNSLRHKLIVQEKFSLKRKNLAFWKDREQLLNGLTRWKLLAIFGHRTVFFLTHS